MCVDAGHPDHQHRGHDQQGVVHGQPQQQRVHGARHRGPGGKVSSLKIGLKSNLSKINNEST